MSLLISSALSSIRFYGLNIVKKNAVLASYTPITLTVQTICLQYSRVQLCYGNLPDRQADRLSRSAFSCITYMLIISAFAIYI